MYYFIGLMLFHFPPFGMIATVEPKLMLWMGRDHEVDQKGPTINLRVANHCWKVPFRGCMACTSRLSPALKAKESGQIQRLSFFWMEPAARLVKSSQTTILQSDVCISDEFLGCHC